MLEFTHTEVNGQPDAVAVLLLKRGYKAFSATTYKGRGDGKAECQAKLKYDVGTVAGDTDNNHGHAEMDCLHQLWVDVCGRDLDTFKQMLEDGLKIVCTAKPCCARCAAVLGAFGIAPSGKTYKTRRLQAGGGAWGMSLDLKDLMKQLFGIKANAIVALSALDQKEVDKHVPRD